MALQLVVPVSFRGQRWLYLLLVQAIQAAFGLQREDRDRCTDTSNTELPVVP